MRIMRLRWDNVCEAVCAPFRRSFLMCVVLRGASVSLHSLFGVAVDFLPGFPICSCADLPADRARA